LDEDKGERRTEMFLTQAQERRLALADNYHVPQAEVEEPAPELDEFLIPFFAEVLELDAGEELN
jgi:hypothetical protein